MMKKKYLFITGAKRWNNLLSQFTKLQNKLQSSNSQNGNLVNKLKSIYSKLEKMQYQTGIKLAGTSLAIVLSAFTANAQFATGQLLQSGGTELVIGYYSSPTFADIDGDGDLDLYVGEYYGSIKVFTNNNGAFTPAPDLQAGGVNISLNYNVKPVFADIDGDGDLDLYVGEYYGKINVFTNNNGVFTAAPDLQAGGIDIAVNYYSAPAFADIDGDGDLDLFVGESPGIINVFTNNAGVFTAAGNLQAGGTDVNAGSYSTPIFEDIDGDGDLDLYVGNDDGKIKVFTNTGGVFSAGVNLLAGGLNINVDHYSKPAFADIDGDGDLDLYVGNSDGEIKVFTNNNSAFTAAPDLQSTFFISNIDVGHFAIPTFEDIDGDGDLDLYVGEHTGLIKVFTNTNGAFTTTENLQAGGTEIDVSSRLSTVFADIDGDGDLDLYAGESAGRILSFINNGAGVFTAAPNLQAGGTDIDVGTSSKPVFADIDGDTDLDLYVGNNDGIIKVFTNNAGVFTVAADLQAGGTNIDVGLVSKPTFEDLDGDGDLDLFVGDWNGGIKVFTNSGGVFTAAADLQAGGANIDIGQGASPTFEDIDGDGDLDLFVGGSSGKITFYENTTLSTILVSSIAIQGAGNAHTITTQGGTLQMNATVLPANASNGSYSWSVANGTGSATIDANGLLTASTDGTVTVTATANDASGEVATMVVTISNQTAVVLVSSITIQGAASANSITTAGGTLQMSATVLPANADDGTYTWSVVNGTGSASINASGLLTAISDGTVEVTATANDASGETATMVVTISNQTTGINELSLQNVNIYPNPVQNELFIELENETINQVEIIDFSGRIVKSVSNNNVSSINVSELNKGMYILKIETDNGPSATRFVKQ